MKKYRYFILSAVILAADQISKILVNARIPLYSRPWGFGGDFFYLTHVRNPGAAFSLGENFPAFLKVIFLIVIPLAVLAAVAVYTIKGTDIGKAQRWCLAGILGGGLGNQIDRIFRPDGVVDFLDVKFYGIWGMERWPTFNIADSALVVSAILLAILLLREVKSNDTDKEAQTHE